MSEYDLRRQHVLQNASQIIELASKGDWSHVNYLAETIARIAQAMPARPLSTEYMRGYSDALDAMKKFTDPPKPAA